MNQYGMLLLIVVVLFAGRIIGPILGPIVNFLVGVPVLPSRRCAGWWAARIRRTWTYFRARVSGG